MGRAVSHYSDFLTSWAALIGAPTSRITTEVAGTANALFNTAMQEIWGRGPWLEITPYGEARFAGDRLTYPNDLSQSSVWTTTAVTATANSVANPADGFTTASKLLETSATSAHKVVQAVTTFFPSTGYTVSFYGRPNGRSYVQLAVSDGVTTYSAFFNLLTGTVGTTANFTTTSIGQQPNGFWLCQATFTANAAATSSGSYTISLSTDGSTLSYAGDTAKGVYLWGNLVQQTTNVPLNDSVIPWDQTGENAIDVLYNAWATNPSASNAPVQLTYELTTNGIQLINATPYQYTYYLNGVAQSSVYGVCPATPVFLYYRKVTPSWTGSTYSATATYSVNDQIYFTDSSGNGDYYKCIVATTAGQSPSTTATSWSVISIPGTFFQYALYQSYADWLISDGQMEKAGQAYGIAQAKMDDAFDSLERQMQQVMPLKMQTHVSTQQRNW